MSMRGREVPAVEAAAVPDDAYILDVREPDEWRAGHIPEAVHIPVGALRERAGEIPSDRDVYVVCRSGARSADAVFALNGAGWRTTNVDGGMRSWAALPRPVVSETGDPPAIV